MRVPTTVSELMNMLNGMEHRERFIFPVKYELKTQFPNLESVEVYATCLHNVKGLPKNINIKAVDREGKIVQHKDGGTLNKSKYLRLFTEDYAKSILSIIDGSYTHNTIESKQNLIEY